MCHERAGVSRHAEGRPPLPSLLQQGLLSSLREGAIAGKGCELLGKLLQSCCE